MECMLLPKNPTALLKKVPLVDHIRYDGGDWLSYPQRRETRWPKLDGYDILPHDILHTYKEIGEITWNEQEPFLQTWLFFGLLSEFFGGNIVQEPATPVPAAHQVPVETARIEIISQLYEKYTYEHDGLHYITTATLLQDLKDATGRDALNREQLLSSRKRLSQCLQIAWRILNAAPDSFDPRIKTSLGVIGELLTHSTNMVFMSFGVPLIALKWSKTYFDEKPMERDGIPTVRKTMLSNGWCPSDISRSMNNFKSFQMLHFFGLMDRSSPPRDHSSCNNVHCVAYQINQDYEVRHVESPRSCKCKLVHVDNSVIFSMLEKTNCIPLLRFIGGMDDLRIDIVPSSEDTPYVAISHVWADGLGNQKANALNSCELIRLRTLVNRLGRQDTSADDPTSESSDFETPLIWIDTLCCPVGPPKFKNLALEKIRHVYELASHVLVLDASLEYYNAAELGLVEKLARIFTSGWLRRLWTLQEGALAKSLYFQFADYALSFAGLRKQVEQSHLELRLQIIYFDFLNEFLRLRVFFKAESWGIPKIDLFTVNAALQYRSVSVPSDEPLCVACLLSLPMTPLLEEKVQEKDRMMILWKLIAKKYGGIPSSIIFFEDKRIDTPGSRWAPASLLTARRQLHGFDTRALRWSDTNLGKPSSNGLKVRFPGYRLSLGKVNDGKPRHPWKGVTRIEEKVIFCREIDTMQWYFFAEKEASLTPDSVIDGGQDAHNSSTKFPLNDLICGGECFIIRGMMFGNAVNEGIIASLVPASERGEVTGTLDGIPVRTRYHITFSEASPAQTILQNTIEILARELRNNELTDKLKNLNEQDVGEADEEYVSTINALKEKMKDMMKGAIQQNPELGPAIDSIWGSKWRDLMWVCIGDWYYNDFKATKLPDDQIWYID